LAADEDVATVLVQIPEYSDTDGEGRQRMVLNKVLENKINTSFSLRKTREEGEENEIGRKRK